MFKIKARFLAAAYIGIMLVFSIVMPVSAQTVNSADFTVQAIIPDNQIDKKQSYFDLLMRPEQSQKLSVNLINSSANEMMVDVALHAASTNRNGIIEYQVQVEADETLKVPFDTIAATDSEVKVAAGSTKTVEISVTMPKEQFDGVILGGITFTKREDNSTSSGVSINNQFSYVIGVKLSETDKEIAPDFKLKSIKPTLINYRRAVIANIHNPVPLIVKDANVVAHIYKKNETESLFSVSKNGVDMAPNSVFPLPIEWEGNTMDPGDYRIELKLTYREKVSSWNENFTIESGQAQDINESALDMIVKAGWWASYWWIFLIIGVILLMWIAFMLGKRRKTEEKD